MVVNEISRKDLDCYITNMTVYDVVDSEGKEETFTYEVNEPGYETVTASDEESAYRHFRICGESEGKYE